jgi:hypothetical protein
MRRTESGDSWRRISVSIAAGATLFTRMSVSANSLPNDLVKAMTPAFAAA